MEFKIKPPYKFKLKNIIFSLIFILAYSISTYLTLQRPAINIDQSPIYNKIKGMITSKSYTYNDKKSQNNNDTSKQNTQDYSDNSALIKNIPSSVDYSKLTINEYVNICVSQTFGEKNSQGKSYLSNVHFFNNNYTIYINIGFYRNSNELKSAAINASVELYKSLYTLYPEKFGHTLFGIVVSGDTINSKGKTTHIDEAAVSWYDKKTLETLDINKLTVDNFKNTVYRFYDYQNQIGIQRD